MLKPHHQNAWYYAAAWWDAGLWNQINLARLVIGNWAAKYGGGKLGPQIMQGEFSSNALSAPCRLISRRNSPY